MATDNGKSDMFEVSGPMASDGSMFIGIRLLPSPDAPPSDGEPLTAFLTINAVRGNLPENQRHRLLLTPEIGAKLGLSPQNAMVANAQIHGVSKSVWTFPVLCMVGAKEMSVLAIDTLRGVFHVDGPAGYWSWKVKRG